MLFRSVTRFHRRYPRKPGPMAEGSEVAELQRRGLSISGFTGAQSLRGGNCHGPSLDDDKALAMSHGSSLDDKAPVTTPAATPAATSIAKLPTVAIGKHDLSFESHSIQDLDALADAELQCRGLSISGFAGAQSLRGGYCHGPSLDDDKAPAMGHGSSLGGRAPSTTPATTSIAKLPTVAIGKHDLSFESHSI